MYNSRLVKSYTILLIIQFIGIALLGYFGYLQHNINMRTLLITWLMVISVVDIIFFTLVMIFQWEQFRYIVLGVSSILINITFLFVLYRYLYPITLFPFMSDLNFFMAFALLIITGIILVDDTTYPFVKWIFLGNLMVLLLYRTPFFFMILAIILHFFQTTQNITNAVWFWMFVSHYVLSLTIGLYKIKMMNRIDFL